MVGVIDTNDVWTCEPQQKGTARGSSGAVSEQRPPSVQPKSGNLLTPKKDDLLHLTK